MQEYCYLEYVGKLLLREESTGLSIKIMGNNFHVTYFCVAFHEKEKFSTKKYKFPSKWLKTWSKTYYKKILLSPDTFVFQLPCLMHTSPPPHSGLWCDTSWKLVCLYPMPHYARGCRISTLIMVAINFWRNSDLSKKKESFSCSKIDKVRAFQRKSLKIFKENLWNKKRQSLKSFWSYFDDFENKID